MIVLFACLSQGTRVYMRYVCVLDDSHHAPKHTIRADWYDCSLVGERNINENVSTRAIFEARKYWARLLLE